jgi:hypothetical protein
MAAKGKKPSIDEVLNLLEKQFGSPPSSARDEDPLLDHLLVAVMVTYADLDGARAIVRGISERFLDFNEARVSPLYELEAVLAPHVPKEQHRAAAWHLRMAMQDVYEGSHGLDLEPIRDATPEEQRAFIKHLPNIPGGAAALVYQIALGDKQLAYGPLEEHLLKRLGLQPRSTTRQRIRAALEKKVKAADRLRFAWLCGHGAHLYEQDFDPSHPFCKLLVRINARELLVREQERKREEARKAAEEKKRKLEEERQRKAEERERIKREKEEAKRARQEELKRKKAEAIAQKKAEAVKKKAAAAKKKAAAAKKKAATAKKKAAAAKKKAAAAKKKAAAAKKKAASSRSAKKKSAKKKTAKKAAKKKAAKKAAKKKIARKAAKKVSKKKVSKKKAAKKKTAKKKAAPKKKAASRGAKKKTAKKKSVRRRKR